MTDLILCVGDEKVAHVQPLGRDRWGLAHDDGDLAVLTTAELVSCVGYTEADQDPYELVEDDPDDLLEQTGDASYSDRLVLILCGVAIGAMLAICIYFASGRT